MATEKRLIDAKQYHFRLSNITMDELFPNWQTLPRDTKDKVCKLAKEHERLLFDEPTVDAVEVVRCKDCEHYEPFNIRPFVGECYVWSAVVKESGFCHCGERKAE